MPGQSVHTLDLNGQFKRTIALLEKTNEHFFITGKAGTGKSTLLELFCQMTKKNLVVLAPTGVAALNVQGQTIHRFFNFYIDVTPEKVQSKKVRPRNPKLYKQLETLLIDEVSMLRADLLDCMDVFLRMYGPTCFKPFGGVQMLFFGDLYQLPPVVNKKERTLFSSYYQSPYFFAAQAMGSMQLRVIELEKVYRQRDGQFVALLNKIRDNSVAHRDITQLNQRYIKGEKVAGGPLSIHLTTTNAGADAVNNAHLSALDQREWMSQAIISGDFGKEYYPTLTHLKFKVGSQIMLLNNDRKNRWVNGSMGIITGLEENAKDQPSVLLKLVDGNERFLVKPFTWEVYQFSLKGNSIISDPVGTFQQYPFRLAWAITVHKSQGKTFDQVVIDIERGTFVEGQLYVALSRCTSFEGIRLKVPIEKRHIRSDPRIRHFLASQALVREQPQRGTSHQKGIEKQ